jgi:hypothetical protein
VLGLGPLKAIFPDNLAGGSFRDVSLVYLSIILF